MAHKDKYRTYDELSNFEEEGEDFRVEILSGDERSSEIVIIAPHGGAIEPQTSQIAREVAGEEFSLYLFEGMKTNCNFETLHITSTRFDEPRCVGLVQKSHTAVSIHGKKEKKRIVLVGGRARGLGESIIKQLKNAGFDARGISSGDVSGTSKKNICNRTASEKGVQLEICRQLRNDLDGSARLMTNFVDSIKEALSTHCEAIS
jgi:phage replication-related protein YjqB (UPF0714/DUF867 family)